MEGNNIEITREGKKKSKKKVYVHCIYVRMGILMVQDPNDPAKKLIFRQRGIDKIHEYVLEQMIHLGFLNKDWAQYDQFPSNYEIDHIDKSDLKVDRFPNEGQCIALLNSMGLQILE